MIFLKTKNNFIKQYRDTDTKTVNFLINKQGAIRVQGRKDSTPYIEPSKKSKKK